MKCIAPYDGLIDVYRASSFWGGIPGSSSTSGTISYCGFSALGEELARPTGAAHYGPWNQEALTLPTFEAASGVRCEQKRNMFLSSNQFLNDSVPMCVAYLGKAEYRTATSRRAWRARKG